MTMNDAGRAMSDNPVHARIDEHSLATIGAKLASQPYAKRGVPIGDTPIRVVLADDHTLFRAGVRVLLRQAPDIDIIGEANSSEEAIAVAERLSPDVLVLDLEMPDCSGLAATQELTNRVASVKVLILSMYSEDEYLLPVLDAGACGYLTKESAEQELLEAIRAVARGDTYVRPRVARLLASHQRTKARSQKDRMSEDFNHLSRRERDVLELVAHGFGGVEIGERLGISNKTVETYKERIEEKLGLKHRSEYITFALSIGLLHP